MQTRGLIPAGAGTGLDLVYTGSGGDGWSPWARALGHWRRHWRRCGLLVPACPGLGIDYAFRRAADGVDAGCRLGAMPAGCGRCCAVPERGICWG